MGFFRSSYRQKIEAAARELCAAHADLLAIGIDDVAVVASRYGFDAASLDLLSRLLERAIERDVDRLTEIFRAGSWTTLQPARLVADWAIGLGLAPPDVARIASASAAPVALAQVYLHIGRIDVAQRQALEDMAAAYGAPPAAALGWIASAVDAEIDRRVETSRSRGSWWQRLAGSQPR